MQGGDASLIPKLVSSHLSWADVKQSPGCSFWSPAHTPLISPWVCKCVCVWSSCQLQGTDAAVWSAAGTCWLISSWQIQSVLCSFDDSSAACIQGHRTFAFSLWFQATQISLFQTWLAWAGSEWCWLFKKCEIFTLRYVLEVKANCSYLTYEQKHKLWCKTLKRRLLFSVSCQTLGRFEVATMLLTPV